MKETNDYSNIANLIDEGGKNIILKPNCASTRQSDTEEITLKPEDIETSTINKSLKDEFDYLKSQSKREKIFFGNPSDQFLHSWNLVASISAKLLEYDDDYVLLECLIDKDERIYEEREFNRSKFKLFDLEEGKLFKLQFFERPYETMMRILDKLGLVSENDFPDIDFESKFKDSPIFKNYT
ncbi:MAG: hypothetical protein K8R54_11575 [Bacteroidales bacterium]|nr:hypothetical protein [Bacteroidales bacterium]